MPKRLTIEDMNELAHKNGGKCLSETYINNNTKLLWECSEGHQWHTAPVNIRNSGSWCPECAGSKKLTIADMHALAAKKNGKCLSKKYTNNRTKLKWQCEKGHIWQAVPSKIQQGRWCPTCARDKLGWNRLSLQDMQQLAAQNNGLCHSTKYEGIMTKLLWECAKGHQWWAEPNSIKNAGSWCPTCAGKNLTIENMHELAKTKGGFCKSEKYTNIMTKLLWECSLGHQWWADPNSIKNTGSWCPDCGGRKKLTLKDMQEAAKLKGGKCKSTEYINIESKLEWECAEGHTWWATGNDIRNSIRWCPHCNSRFYHEDLCRTTFEQLFEEVFPKSRPLWLRNERGNRMEIDGYCAKLKIGFEYHGEQHFKQKKYFNMSSADLQKRQQDDQCKEDLCELNKVFLFVITYKDDLQKLPSLIKTKAEAMNLDVSLIDFNKNIDFNKIYEHKTFIEELQEIAKSHKGKLISKKYINSETKLLWECSQQHRWWTTPSSIKNGGTWCISCAGQQKLNIQIMQEIAESKGGICLSKKYINNKTKLEWQCAYGHNFWARPDMVKNRGQWCPTCLENEKKNQIKLLNEIAKEKGGRCVSKNYEGSRTNLIWECKRGHRWLATPSAIKNTGTWCEKCARISRRDTIELMQKLAAAKGGECLSDQYVSNNQKLKWRCSVGHEWLATPNSIKNAGSWCPECSGRNISLIDMHKLAETKNGKCLSTTYDGIDSKLQWECDKGHTWLATPSSIKNQGTWCRKCAGKEKLTIEIAREIAKQRNGRCLSDKYINTKSKLKWECSKKHTWFAALTDIKNGGNWCPECAGKKKLTIADMRKIAQDRGGKCLSKSYHPKKKLKWECAEGHQWEAHIYGIKNLNRWCPHCNNYFHEEICRTTFEQLFNKKFPKVRPEWLRNARGNKMEIDGYCEELKIGFEYHGRQHFTNNHYFNMSDADLSLRQKDDLRKEKLCKANGVVLFIITFEDDLNQLPVIIKNQSTHIGLKIHDVDFNKEIDFNKIYLHKTLIQQMQELAAEKGGKCLSKKYIDIMQKLEWECAEGHRWWAEPNRIKNSGSWCKKCAGNEKLTIQEMQNLANGRGGRCLSKEYINSKTKLIWECAKGHQWKAKPCDVKNSKNWCKKCSGNEKLTIEDMHKFAKDRGGKCLSKEYNGAHIKLLWECSEGHQWAAKPASVRNRGSWCKTCAGNDKLTIEEMHKIAADRGGKCLSTEYINSSTKLKWQCRLGHEWKATPIAIKHGGSWCPQCTKKQPSKLKSNIDEMQRIAAIRGGRCVSTVYVDSQTKLIWECDKHHRWRAKPGNIKNRNSWCPKCSGQQKHTIADMHQLAQMKNGLCLSKNYINNKTKLEWHCAHGHTFWARPDMVKNRGRWCPTCAKAEKAQSRQGKTQSS